MIASSLVRIETSKMCFERGCMANASLQNGLTLVLGANGKTGRRVADRLKIRNLPVRLGSRSGTPPFAWEDRSTWPAALQGVRAIYISYYPDISIPSAADDIQTLIDMAVKQGVQRLVLLSGRGEPEAQACEAIVRKSGMEWTILCATWFAQNFSEGQFLEPILAGELALPVGNIAEPFVDADDIADVAIAALTDDRHIGQLYELTGLRALTFSEAVSEIARASKRDIQFIAVTPDAYRNELVKAQLPTEVIDLVLYLFTTVLDGRNTPLADGVQRALGRAPRDFSAYAKQAAATGMWRI
jgi:uncharacterized protein YbjT (DUF2867 family)